MGFQTSLKLIFMLSQNVDMLNEKCDMLGFWDFFFFWFYFYCFVVMGIEPKACKTLLHSTIELYTLYSLRFEKGFP